MAEEILVAPLSPALIEAGRNFVERLQNARFPVAGALWLMRRDEWSWQLFIISRAAESLRPIKLYESVLKHAPKSGYPFWPSTVTVLSPTDSFAAELQNALRATSAGGDDQPNEAWICLSTSEMAPAYIYKRW